MKRRKTQNDAVFADAFILGGLDVNVRVVSRQEFLQAEPFSVAEQVRE
jgi:hypothetical protein